MKILVFPQESNPYQELLYGPMRPKVTVTYLTARFDGPLRAATFVPRLILRLIQRRVQGFTILHIHWLYTLAVPAFMPFSKHIAYIQTLLFLYSAKLLGYKLVWTAHNVLPHSQITINDTAIRKVLARLCSAVIVHSNSTLAALTERNITPRNAVLIPHGNYIGVYTNTLNQAQSRKKLGIPARATVISLVGALHPYKNVPELIDAFVALAKTDSSLYLLLAGKDKDTRISERIHDLPAAYRKRLQLHDSYIPDDELQLYLNAADICAFPFSEITTSGSVLLAASFGKPIVAPYLGAIQDIPKTVGKLYDPTKPKALGLAVADLLADRSQLKAMSAASHAYAASLSWDVIAQKTEQIYRKV